MARWFSWLERRPVTAEVAGSSPARVVFIKSFRDKQICACSSAWIEHLATDQGVGGSNPLTHTKAVLLGSLFL